MLFSVLIVVGLAACSTKEDPRLNPDQIITEKVFNDAMSKQCNGSGECVIDKVVMPRIEKHCSENKLTSAQCDELAGKVASRINQYLKNRIESLRRMTDQIKQATEKIKDEQRQKERRVK